MSQRTPSQCLAISRNSSISAARAAELEMIQLDDVAPGREVRIASLGQQVWFRFCFQKIEVQRIFSKIFLQAADVIFGMRCSPRMVRRSVVRDEVQESNQCAAREVSRGRNRDQPTNRFADRVYIEKRNRASRQSDSASSQAAPRRNPENWRSRFEKIYDRQDCVPKRPSATRNRNRGSRDCPIRCREHREGRFCGRAWRRVPQATPKC